MTAAWWIFLPLGVVVATTRYGPYVVIAAGVVLDTTFGTPVSALGGFQYVYTVTFICAAFVSSFLTARMVQ